MPDHWPLPLKPADKDAEGVLVLLASGAEVGQCDPQRADTRLRGLHYFQGDHHESRYQRRQVLQSIDWADNLPNNFERDLSSGATEFTLPTAANQV